jgi:hypothetical protein
MRIAALRPAIALVPALAAYGALPPAAVAADPAKVGLHSLRMADGLIGSVAALRGMMEIARHRFAAN